MRPWLVFYGTLTALIEDATDADDAFTRFLGQQFPQRGSWAGRITPPVREEVRVRPLEPSDADWVHQIADERFLRALRDAASP